MPSKPSEYTDNRHPLAYELEWFMRGENIVRRVRGTVKYYDPKGGFGYLRRDDDPKAPDVYVHGNAVASSPKYLTDGERVTFEQIDHGKGPTAMRVRRLGEH